jgi:integrase
MPTSVTDAQDPEMDMIEAYAEYMKFKSFSQETIDDRTETLRRIRDDLPEGLASASRNDLEAWLHNDDFSPGTKSTYFKAIKGAYTFWADPDDPWMTFDPTIGMARPPRPRGVAHPVEDDQLWELLERCRQPFRRWVVLGAYQGLRCCEIAGLDREHVTRERLYVVRGKGGQPRVHDTDPMVWDEVKDLPPGPVARRTDGSRATAHQITNRAWEYFHETLGLNVSMHQLRHWLGVNTQRTYKDIRVTQAVLGHASLSSTQIYTEADMDQQRAARAMLPRPGAGVSAVARPDGSIPTPTSRTPDAAA